MGRGSRSASWAQTLRARQRETFMWWGGVGAAHRLLPLGGTVGFQVALGLPSQGEESARAGLGAARAQARVGSGSECGEKLVNSGEPEGTAGRVVGPHGPPCLWPPV